MRGDSGESQSRRVSDKQLLAGYHNGDETAATVLFHRYYVQLTRLARDNMGWLAHVEESSDVAQSVFQSVFKRADRIELAPDGSLWPWLFRVAMNKIRNRAKYWHRQRRDRRRETALEGRGPLEIGPTPQDVAIVRDKIQELLEPFGARRQAIVELLLQDVGIAEIAARVGVTERTVYKTRQAAQLILRQLAAAS